MKEKLRNFSKSTLENEEENELVQAEREYDMK